MNTKIKEVDHARDQAKAQLESIQEMVKALKKTERCANGSLDFSTDEYEEAEQTIQEDALSIEVRSGWHTVGTEEAQSDAEFNILLCTGGPAVRIIGTLGAHAEPESARLEYQDWGTPWTGFLLTSEEEEMILRYCRCFYFGE